VFFDTGLNELSAGAEQFLILPNPTHGYLELKFNTAAVRTIEVVDALGRMIQTKTLSGNSGVIDLSKHADGVYYVKIVSDNRSSIRKVVKQQ
jgi:hypothetical protein